MKALFLVGGSGTRLRPFTKYLPKPMIPVMGRPLLERSCARLQEAGIGEVVMNPCYMPKKITDYFKDGVNFGLEVHYAKEEEPLGTGGTIKNTAQYYDESFFVLNAGVLCDISLPDMMDFHKKKKADITIATTKTDSPTPYGAIACDGEDYILEFKERPGPEEANGNYINAGIYIVEPCVLEEIPAGRPVSMEEEIFPLLLEKGWNLAVYRDIGYWMDIRTPREYVQAHRDIFAGLYDVGGTNFDLEQICIEESAVVDDSALLDSAIFIGKKASVEAHNIINSHVVLGDGVVIEPNCYLEDTIIWPGTYIPGGSFLRHSIVMQVNGKLLELPYERLHVHEEGRRVFNER